MNYPALPTGPRARPLSQAAIAALIALSAGCSLQPAYQRPDLPVASAYPTGPAYQAAPSAPGATTLPAADIGWRDVLTDPRLQRLVEIALQNNLDLRVAVLNVAQARAQYGIQQADLFPQISGFADGSRERTPGSLTATGKPEIDTTWKVGVSSAWEIDFFGRLRSLSDAAFQQYLASAQARKAAEILLVSEVADQYLTLLADDDLLAVTKRVLETSRASYQIVQLQFNTGTATELDLRQAQTILEQAQANYAAQARAGASRKRAGAPARSAAARGPAAGDPHGQAGHPRRHPRGAAVGPAHASSGHPGGRGQLALGEC